MIVIVYARFNEYHWDTISFSISTASNLSHIRNQIINRSSCLSSSTWVRIDRWRKARSTWIPFLSFTAIDDDAQRNSFLRLEFHQFEGKEEKERHHRGWNDIARRSRHRLVPRYIFRDRSDVTFIAFSEHDLPLSPVTCKSHFPRESIDVNRSMSFERLRRSTLTADFVFVSRHYKLTANVESYKLCFVSFQNIYLSTC